MGLKRGDSTSGWRHEQQRNVHHYSRLSDPVGTVGRRSYIPQFVPYQRPKRSSRYDGYACVISDFSKAAARMSEGFCPLCGFRMVVAPNGEDASATCTRCDVGWSLSTLDDGWLMLAPSRKLTDAELRFLYDRST